MNVLAIVGSPRKGRSTDTLVDKAIEGVRSTDPNCSVKKIHMADHRIEFCRDCLACWKNTTAEPYAPCVIRDDMDMIYEEIAKADRLIFGTPVHMGYATGIMMTFLERICWTFARPEVNYLTVKGCPAPRVKKERKAVIIAVSSIVPPYFKLLCNAATPQIAGAIKDSLNAKTVGKLYAGDIVHRGLESYGKKAFQLGEKLA
jgi:multimeric flavodoxin WrbA